MTFAELQLAMAIHSLNQHLRDAAPHAELLKFANNVQDQFAALTGEIYFPFMLDDVKRLAMAVRKSTDTRTKAEVAIAHGWRCFWIGRGKGGCCENAECGHLVPRCRGGELTIANCVIECRRHNNERREKTIEEYLFA